MKGSRCLRLRIGSIDGTAITANYASDPISSWSIDRPGRVVKLGICGGDTRLLTLERFY